MGIIDNLNKQLVAYIYFIIILRIKKYVLFVIVKRIIALNLIFNFNKSRVDILNDILNPAYVYVTGKTA